MQQTSIRRTVLIGLFGVALLASVLESRSDDAPDPELVARGKLLYRIYCTNCHGVAGRGDGPTASILTVKPADLTDIRAANGGNFPTEKVYATIDGREAVAGHGERKMPIWGLGLQELDRDVDQEAEVRARIASLVEYLRSLQP